MKCNAWTLALIGAGLVSVPAVTHADETTNAVPSVPSLLTSLASTTLSGYVDTSAQWNFGTGNANLPQIAPNAPGAGGGTKADGFNLNLVNVTISHPAGDGWSAGYNASLLMGPDAVGYNNFSGAGDLSLKDAYVDLHAPIGNGLDFKLGTFGVPMGYEVYETGNNPNYTRSYGYEIEPTSLTGFLASYQICGPLTASFGIANTWSSGINARGFSPNYSVPPSAPGSGPKAESYKTYMGSLTFTSPTNSGFLSGSTLSGAVVSGFDAVNSVVKTSWYLGGTVNTPVNNLKLGFAIDYVDLANNNLDYTGDANSIDAGGTGAESAGYQSAYGLYLSFQATEKLSLYTRGEYLSQSKYLAVSSGGYQGMPEGAYELTQTVQYDLWKNVLARIEFRWDHAEHGHPYSGTSAGTVDLTGGGATALTGSAADAFLLAANLVYKF